MVDETNEIVIRYYALLRRANKHTVSQRVAEDYVGGKVHLKNLIAKGEIRHGEGANSNAWRLNARDVFEHCRCD